MKLNISDQEHAFSSSQWAHRLSDTQTSIKIIILKLSFQFTFQTKQYQTSAGSAQSNYPWCNIDYDASWVKLSENQFKSCLSLTCPHSWGPLSWFLFFSIALWSFTYLKCNFLIYSIYSLSLSLSHCKLRISICLVYWYNPMGVRVPSTLQIFIKYVL